MKLNDREQKHQQALIIAGMKNGIVAVPYALVRCYRELKLTELEAMVLIQLIGFMEKENNDFPTLDQLQSRMMAKPDLVISAIQKLMKDQFISIDEEIDNQTGIRYERYNLHQMYDKLAKIMLNDITQQQLSTAVASEPASKSKDIYSIIEREFGRPLTPMELEMISGWMDADQYKEEIILTALKEAVFAGKLHFRYIDRILLDWSRNQITNAELAKTYSQKFRQSR
jgi:DNA replication protein